MATENDRRCPIVCVRGFAGGQGAIEETVADPLNGFNDGSKKIRQLSMTTQSDACSAFSDQII